VGIATSVRAGDTSNSSSNSRPDASGTSTLAAGDQSSNQGLDAASSSSSFTEAEDSSGRAVLNIGFGMGIVDNALQRRKPSRHVIVEAHPAVY